MAAAMPNAPHDLRLILLAALVCLGAACGLRVAGRAVWGHGRPLRAALPAAAPVRTAGGTSRIPLLAQLLGAFGPRAATATPGLAAAFAPHSAPTTTGGSTLAECLADQRRPDAQAEVAALTAAPDAPDAQPLPVDLAQALALEATDRAYQDALSRAAELADPAAALAQLEAALADLPAAHRVGRVRVLEAMLPLARVARTVADRLALSARLRDERDALVTLAARSGVLDATAERQARAELDESRRTGEALEPLLANLLDAGRHREGRAD